MGRISGPISLDAGSVNNSHISNQAADIIDAAKVMPVVTKTERFGLYSGDTPVSKTVVIYQAQKAGTIRAFNAGLVAGGSSASMTFDLKKNGTSVLSAPVTVTNTNGNRSQVSGAIATPSYVAGDLFEVVLTVSSSTGATGPYATASFSDTSAP